MHRWLEGLSAVVQTEKHSFKQQYIDCTEATLRSQLRAWNSLLYLRAFLKSCQRNFSTILVIDQIEVAHLIGLRVK